VPLRQNARMQRMLRCCLPHTTVGSAGPASRGCAQSKSWARERPDKANWCNLLKNNTLS
jgi:hypothetical protein